MHVEHIARVAHEANRAYSAALGDFDHQPWSTAPLWQRRSAISGVQKILDGTITTPEDAHKSWMAEKVADGWEHGPKKSASKKTHPRLVPYDELPVAQRRKDALFFAIVHALREDV